MLLPNDDQVTYEQVARVSRKDADALAPFNALFEKAALLPQAADAAPAAGGAAPSAPATSSSCCARPAARRA